MGAPGTSLSLIGVTIGNYRVVSKLGEGGMGAVYLAEHPLIGKKVALKVLHSEYARNPDVVARFFNEARAVNEIGHPNIVDVVDYGVVERPGESLVYFMMEFLAGQSLKAVLEREAPLPAERALAIAAQIGDALAASHDKGVIHRDLKPDNVYLIARGRERDFVKVLDFGIAKLSREPGSLGRTRSGVVMGTPLYMSPEQCEGRRDIDPRSDVYALGVMLYEMLTGQVPFSGEGYGEVILAHVTQPPRPPSQQNPLVTPAVEAIVMKALEKRRIDRFGSMEQLVEALRDPPGFVARGPKSFTEPRAARPAGAQRGGRGGGEREQVGEAPTMAALPTTLGHTAAELAASPRSRAPVIAASAIVVLGIIGGAAYFLTRGEPSQAEEPAPVAAAGGPAPSAAPPPAAPEPQAVATPPARPARVTVRVSSVPDGAEVRIGDVVHGLTPLAIELPRSDEEVTLTLDLDGYKVERKKVRLGRDAELLVTLDRQPTRRSRRHERREVMRPAPVGEPERPAPAVAPAPAPAPAPEAEAEKPAAAEPPAAEPVPPPARDEKPADLPPAPHKPDDDDVLPPTFDKQ